MDKINQAVELICNSKNVIGLTGAGISTESGIPDFRSSTGYYATMDPMAALSRDTLMDNPKRFYNEGFRILVDIQGKKPNAGHLALKKLQDLGKMNGIITQNIDNLHVIAGSNPVYEVHGDTRGVHCDKCKTPWSFDEYMAEVEKGKVPPKCKKCGGMMRPNVVMFGDMMPPAFDQAYNAASHSDLMIVVGSSLSVMPVSYLPQMTKHLIIINKEPTPFDNVADVVFHNNSGETLAAIADGVEKALT